MAADTLFSAPLLSALDARGRADLRAAARRRTLEAGASVFVRGDPADAICVVERGTVAIEAPGERSTAHAGELFGRDALVSGTTRAGPARALEASVVLEIPAGALRRALARAGAGELFAKEEARARERTWLRLLASTPLGARLSPKSLAELVAAGREEVLTRGSALCAAGDPGVSGFVVLRGLVALAASASRTEPAAYAGAGDLVGFGEALSTQPYAFGASALGEVALLRVPATLLRRLAELEPEAFADAERATRERREKQRRLQGAVAGRATRHAFHELERLESARSLLAIDLESCVRCGHCAWACADAHGSVRLARRGDKVALALREPDGALAERALLLAHACQHCKDPACLPECPTGAISRTPDGTVLLREDLCTGCGACAKACGWDAIRMAPRTHASAGGADSALVAVKCDLCQGLSGPECVSACPTGAVLRLDPARDVAEVRSLIGGAKPERRPASRGARVRGLLLLACLPPLVALARAAVDHPTPALRYVTGVLAGIACVVLALHALVKRRRKLRAWIERRLPARGESRGLERLSGLHASGGALSLFLVLSHAGFTVPRGSAGALAAAFWLVAASGLFGALSYRVLPRRLARLERRGTLPEDRAREREELEQALFDGVSAQNLAVKELARRVLVPYANARLGAVVLALSGRALADEERALSLRIEALLGGRRSERLGDVGKLVEVAVALRALGARRLLELGLAAWLPLHALGAALLLGLLALHVVGVLR
jgi:Fe-S-cluster-containing dehydrogenase component